MLSVEIGGAEAAVHRSLELDSCVAAAEATALMYAVAASEQRSAEDSEPSEHEPRPEPISDVQPQRVVPKPRDVATDASEPDRPPSSVDPPPRPEPGPPARGSREFRGLVTMGGGLSLGGVAPWAGHVEAGLGLGLWRLRLGLYAGHAFARRFASQDVAARVSATTGAFRVGVPVAFGGRFELEPALVTRGGGLRGEGSGGLRAGTRWVPWATVGAAVALSVDLVPRLGLRLDTALDVPMLRHTFTFDDLILRSTGPVGGQITLGVQLRFSTARR